jgi:hypothetical protein
MSRDNSDNWKDSNPYLSRLEKPELGLGGRDRLCPVRRRNGGTGSVRSASETEGPALSGPTAKRRDRLCPVRQRNGGNGSVRSDGGRDGARPSIRVRQRTRRSSSLHQGPTADETELVPPGSNTSQDPILMGFPVPAAYSTRARTFSTGVRGAVSHPGATTWRSPQIR